MPPGIARPLRNGRVQVRTTIQRNNARVVDHFRHHHHVIAELQQLHIVVVFARQHGWAGVKTDQTALGQAAVFGIVFADTAQQKARRALTQHIGTGGAALQNGAFS